jgi:hypothetical protein
MAPSVTFELRIDMDGDEDVVILTTEEANEGGVFLCRHMP